MPHALWTRPGHSALCVLTLALGIGATTGIFSVVDALMLRGHPYGDVDRIVEFEARYNGQPASGYFTFVGSTPCVPLARSPASRRMQSATGS